MQKKVNGGGEILVAFFMLWTLRNLAVTGKEGRKEGRGFFTRSTTSDPKFYESWRLPRLRRMMMMMMVCACNCISSPFWSFGIFVSVKSRQ